MCRPSATSAIDPNSSPPMISAAIIAPHRMMTAQVLRSLRSWSVARKTWLCPCSPAPGAYAFMRMPLPEVGVKNLDQLVRRAGTRRPSLAIGVDQVAANVLLQHLRHQPRGGSTHAGDQVHHRVATDLRLQGSLDALA